MTDLSAWTESNTPIVIDVGSGTLKAGWASDDAPVRVIRKSSNAKKRII